MTPCRSLERQFGRSHQVQVNRAGALAALADRPDHKALPAPHVPTGKDIFDAGLIIDDIGGHITTWVESNF